MIYNGQLDIIIAVPLTEAWLQTVQWTGLPDYMKAERQIWKINPSDTEVAGWVRQVQNFYQVNTVVIHSCYKCTIDIKLHDKSNAIEHIWKTFWGQWFYAVGFVFLVFLRIVNMLVIVLNSKLHLLNELFMLKYYICRGLAFASCSNNFAVCLHSPFQWKWFSLKFLRCSVTCHIIRECKLAFSWVGTLCSGYHDRQKV